MEYKLIGISCLILIILGLTWIKDGEHMNPPLKKRAVIDIVTIGIFWVVFEFLDKSGSTTYTNEIVLVINASLFFFFARLRPARGARFGAARRRDRHRRA